MTDETSIESQMIHLGISFNSPHYLTTHSTFLIIICINMQNISYLLAILNLATLACTLNIPLPRSRETCLVLSQGSYQFQFVVSGINEQQVRCLISDSKKIILDISGESQYETEFAIGQDEASICFSSLDSQAKSVSFDFIRTDDPLRGLIKNKQKMEIHETLYSSYQQLQKLYRDQHFFMERNFVHQILLRNTEIALVFFSILKLLVVLLASCFQLYFVRQLFETNYRPVSSEDSP